MKIISVINLKGGVGKSTSAINIAHILSVIHNKRVLIVDNDKQANTTDFFMLGRGDIIAPVGGMLVNDKSMLINGISFELPIVVKTFYENLSIIPSNITLIDYIQELMQDKSNRPKHLRFKEQLAKVSSEFDYCIIDNPPDFNLSVINALVASHDVLVPVKADKFTIDGLEEITEQIENIKEVNKNISFKGCFLTMFLKNRINKETEEWLKNQSKYPVFETVIRNSIKVSETTFVKKPLLKYAPKCNTTLDYIQLVEEYLQK